MTRLIVRAHQPWRVRLFAVLSLVAVVGSGWGLFEYGRIRGGYDRVATASEKAALLAASAEDRKLAERSREQLVILERTREVERKAYDDLEQAVATLQDEIQELKGELAFYRGIVSPSDGREGLTLQEFGVTPALGDRAWRYKLVLTQVRKNDTVAIGSVDMTIEGIQAGEPARLPIKTLAKAGKLQTAFRFKYFQDMQGEFVLPEGFQPAKILVVVDPRGSKHQRLEESYDWPAEES